MNRYYLGLAALSAIMLLGSTLIEYTGSPEWEGSWFESSKTWELFFKEIGVALVIALGISMTIEKHAKKQQSAEVKDLMNKVKKNVFEAAYGVTLPKTVVDAAMDQILNQKFFRTDSRSYYELEIKEFDRTDGTSIKAVLLKGHCHFKVTNVSSKQEDYTLNVSVEKPLLSDLKDVQDVVQIHSVIIDHHRFTKEEIDEYDEAGPDTDDFKKLVYTKKLNSDESLEGDFSFSVIRGLDDAEFWMTFVPNDGMTLQVRMPKEIDAFGVTAIHREEAILTQESPETGFYEWQLPHTVLPNQGMMIWWRHSDSTMVRQFELEKIKEKQLLDLASTDP